MQRREQQRRMILEAAAHAIASRGFHGMSMRQLAKETGRGLASFYSYFDSKDELLFSLQTQAFEALLSTLEDALTGIEDPEARFHAFILNHVRYVSSHRDVMRVLVHEAGTLPPERRATVRALKDEYYERGQEVIRAVIERAASLDEPELGRATYSVFGMLNWLYGWYQPDRHGPPEEVARTICGIATRGLADGRGVS